ncbi:Cytoplasmic glyoxalase II [Coemansia sp. RSA 1365]|nr:Cytoplasmic glyoxalase II [Coemansia sp. RSA 1365]
MRIIPVACLGDNYSYVLVDDKAMQATVVDPVEPEKVHSAVKETGMELKTMLTTHHHADHAGGNQKIVESIPSLVVYGGDSRIPKMTHQLHDGDEFEVGSLRVCAMQTFGHTTSSICYYIQDPSTDQRVVFTGDTLFVGGCGRLFEGTPSDMYKSLKKLATLPKDTKVYVGHEYTKTNLQFALTVDGDNQALKDKVKRCATMSCTMPSTIAEELATNPFMRVDQPALQKATGKSDPIDVLAVLRQMKDRF